MPPSVRKSRTRTKKKSNTNAKRINPLRCRTDIIIAHEHRFDAIEKYLNFILNDVSANGRPGLQNSLQDIYNIVKQNSNEIMQLRNAMQVELDRKALINALKKYFNSSYFSALFKTKKSTFVFILLFVVILNSLAHPLFGYNMNIQGMSEFLFKVFTR